MRIRSSKLVVALLAAVGVASSNAGTVDFDFADEFKGSFRRLQFSWIGAAAVSVSHQDTDTVLTLLNAGLESTGAPVSNDGSINLVVRESVAVNADLSTKFYFPALSDLKAGSNWVKDNGPKTEGKTSSVWSPGYSYVDNRDVLISLAGMSVAGTSAVNNGTITESVVLNANRNAGAKFSFSTGNSTPTPEEINSNSSGLQQEWKIQPVISSAAQLNADITLASMFAWSTVLSNASAVNNGTIVIDAYINKSSTTTTNVDWGNADEFKVYSQDGSKFVSLELVEDSVTAATAVYANALAAGMYARTDVMESVSLDRFAALPQKVSLINNGTIRISAGEEFVAVGMMADIAADTTVYASNLGTIDLSESQSDHRHQLLARVEETGSVVLGDWLLDSGAIEGIVPFAVQSESGNVSGSALSFAEGSTLYLAVSRVDQLEGTVSVGALFGSYDENGNFSGNDASYVDGSFSRIVAASSMMAVGVDGSDLNNLKFSFTVNPKNSLGADLQHKSINAGLDSFLALRNATILEDEAHDWLWEAVPWVSRGNFDGSRGFDVVSTGLILRGSGNFAGAEGMSAAGYLAFLHENLEGDALTADASTQRFGLGVAVKKALTEKVSLGARIDAGYGDSEWKLRDTLQSVSADADSNYLYGEINVDVHTKFTAQQ